MQTLRGTLVMVLQRQAEVVLARWREVERTIADLRDDDERLEALHYEAAQLRDEYQALVRSADDHGGATPKRVGGVSGT